MPWPFGDARPNPATRPPRISTSPATSVPSTRAASTPSLTARPPAHGRCCRRTASSRARAVPASTPARSDTIATRVLPSASARAASTSSDDAPVAAPTIRRTRSWSFSFAATTSTMRFPYVLPRRIIEIVEIVLSTSFCAVPALRRVDPAMNSGPTTTAISWSTSAPSSESDAATTQAVSAPVLLAVSSAPST